jgi:hypothetical protein
MNYHVYENQMPRLTLTYEELKDIMQILLSRISGTFDFNGFVKTVANHLVQNQIGFKVATNTSYKPEMDWNDVSIIREIIWDFIVLRYVTVGGYGTDTWPSLTITQRGLSFFANLKNES